MNLTIEDLEAIKAIVREVVKEELARFGSRLQTVNRAQQPAETSQPKQLEQPQEVVARIPRM